MQAHTSLFYKSVVFLPKITDRYSEEGDNHLARCRVPAKRLDAQFEAEIVDGQIKGNDEDIARQLSPTVKFGCRESDIFLQPKSGQQRNREDDT